jgi:hypothetical protein
VIKETARGLAPIRLSPTLVARKERLIASLWFDPKPTQLNALVLLEASSLPGSGASGGDDLGLARRSGRVRTVDSMGIAVPLETGGIAAGSFGQQRPGMLAIEP